MKLKTVLLIIAIFILGILFWRFAIDRVPRSEHDAIRKERDSLVAVVPAILTRHVTAIEALQDSLNKIRPQVDTTRLIEYHDSRKTTDSLRRVLVSRASLRDSVETLLKIVAADSVAMGRADSILQHTAGLLAIAESALVIATDEAVLNKKLYESLRKTQELDCYILDQKWLGRCPSHTVTAVVGVVVGGLGVAIAK